MAVNPFIQNELAGGFGTNNFIPKTNNLPKFITSVTPASATPTSSNIKVNTTQSITSNTNANLLGETVDTLEKNVLNSYRSLTYNFTLSGLSREALNDPLSYRDSELRFTIIRSGGKGGEEISTDVTRQPITRDIRKNYETGELYDATGLYITDNSAADTDKAKKMVSGFNQYSPGRFDMFIDNVEIKSTMSFTPSSNLSLVTEIRFEVIEPYSVDGFIEALQTVAAAAGYITYSQACFLLKIQFIGYPDSGDDEFTTPEVVPNADRYIVFRFTGVEIDVTERGTRYVCAAAPVEQFAFGQIGTLKKPISANGSTVGEILKDFISGVNETQNAISRDSKETPNGSDFYEIRFDSWDDKKGQFVSDSESKIATSKMIVAYRENVENPLEDPQVTSMSNNYKIEGKIDNTVSKPVRAAQFNLKAKQTNLEQARAALSVVVPTSNTRKVPVNIDTDPRIIQAMEAVSAAEKNLDKAKSEAGTQRLGVLSTNASLQFPERSSIHECIINIIRDSTYPRDLLSSIAKGNAGGVIDSFGMVDWYIVRTEITNQTRIDNQTKRPYQNITYIVSPYKIHYTRLPNYQSLIKDVSNLKVLCLRSYEYIYTGQNVDILDFKLNFNNLYYEAIPVGMANTDSKSEKNSMAPAESLVVKADGVPYKTLIDSSTPVAATMPTASSSQVNPESSGTAGGPLQEDPYFTMSRLVNETLIHSKASMITGEINILGDPFYLVTGGIGNYTPISNIRGKTTDGEANHLFSEVLINISFRNPVDLGNLETGGSVIFETRNASFTGIYRVTQVINSFREGVFKQNLNIIRVPGELGIDRVKIDIRDIEKTSQNSKDASQPDIAKNLFLDNTQPTPPYDNTNSLLNSIYSKTSNISNAVANTNVMFTDLQKTIGAVPSVVQNGINLTIKK